MVITEKNSVRAYVFGFTPQHRTLLGAVGASHLCHTPTLAAGTFSTGPASLYGFKCCFERPDFEFYGLPGSLPWHRKSAYHPISGKFAVELNIALFTFVPFNRS